LDAEKQRLLEIVLTLAFIQIQDQEDHHYLSRTEIPSCSTTEITEPIPQTTSSLWLYAINYAFRVRHSEACREWPAGVSRTVYDIHPTAPRTFAIALQLVRQLENCKDGKAPTSIAWTSVSIMAQNAPLIAVDVIRMKEIRLLSLPYCPEQRYLRTRKESKSVNDPLQ